MAETLAPGACVSEIARRNELTPSLLFTWRRQARVQPSDASSVFLLLQVAAEPATAAIEIDIGAGRGLTVGADVDAAALARVLDMLERR